LFTRYKQPNRQDKSTEHRRGSRLPTNPIEFRRVIDRYEHNPPPKHINKKREYQGQVDKKDKKQERDGDKEHKKIKLDHFLINYQNSKILCLCQLM
jgi:hypothetical protein